MWYVTVVCGRQGSGQRFANTPGSIRLFYQDVTHSLESIVSLPIHSQEIALWVAIACMRAVSRVGKVFATMTPKVHLKCRHELSYQCRIK